jgi:hypothetical protein
METKLTEETRVESDLIGAREIQTTSTFSSEKKLLSVEQNSS